MNKKIENGCLYALSLLMCLNLCSCSMDTETKEVIDEHELYEEHFDTYVTKGIVEEKVEQKYWAQNVVIGINKKTNEISRYIYYYGEAGNYLYNNIMNPTTLRGNIVELFNLDNGNLIYFNKNNDPDFIIGSKNLEKLIEENEFYFLSNYYEDIDLEYKAWYTVDEINEIAEKFIEKKENIKKLELTTK